MASGYLFLSRTEDYSKFFRKRARRVIIPFVIWSLVYASYLGDFTDKGVSFKSIGNGLLGILSGPAEYDLWFFYVLIGLYLAVPILRIFCVNASAKDLLYFCALWFLFEPVLSVIHYYTGATVGILYPLTGYVGYYVLGFYFGHLAESRTLNRAALVILLGSYGFLLLTIYHGWQDPKYDEFFEHYLSIARVLMCGSMFVLLKAGARFVGPRTSRVLAPLSEGALGIYLAHALLLDLMGRYLGPILPVLQTGPTLVVMPAVASVVYGICFLITRGLERVPLVRYALP
jgi:surface polysaccharide O-acyltransferase-like enzyme